MVRDEAAFRPLVEVARREDARQAGELDAVRLLREESPPMFGIVLGGGDLDEPSLAALDMRGVKRLWGRLSVLITAAEGGGR